MASCCPHCDYTFGGFFLHEWLRDLWVDADYKGVANLEAGGAHHGLPHPHWCVDTGSGLCVVPPPDRAPTTKPEGGIEVDVQVGLVGDGPGEIPVREVVRRMFDYY